MDRRHFIKTAAGIAAVGVMAQAGLGRRAFAGEPLKVGILIPMSGPAGLFGPASRDCARMAVARINGAGGILGRPIEPIFVDVGGAPADAVQSVLKVWKGQGAEAFVGMHDSAVRDALINLFKGQVPYVYTAVYEGGACGKGLFVIGETPEQQLKPVIPWLAANKGASKWYLIGNDYNWPRDTNTVAKRYIAASGGKVVGEEYLPFSADNYDSNLAKIRQSGADAVLVTLVGGASVGFNRAFASFGLADQALRFGTLIEENTLAGIGADGSRNLYSALGYYPSVSASEDQAFARQYRDQYGDGAPLLNALSESCFDGLLLLDALAKKAGALRAPAMDAAAVSGVSYHGPRGTVTMKDHQVAYNIYLARARGTAFDVIKTFDAVSSGADCR